MDIKHYSEQKMPLSLMEEACPSFLVKRDVDVYAHLRSVTSTEENMLSIK